MARTADAIPGYLTTVLAAPGQWIDAAPDEVARFLSAFSQGVRRVLRSVHREQCLALITDTWQVSEPIAARILSEATDSQTGLVPDGAVEGTSLAAILDLRRRWGGFSHGADVTGEIRRPRGLVDERFAPER
ncbi:MAG TPA: hypothetical protein VGG75_18450 [Trebonia sp.]